MVHPLVRARDFLYLRLILIETRFLELAFWTTHPRNLGYFLSVVSTHSEYASDILPALYMVKVSPCPPALL